MEGKEEEEKICFLEKKTLGAADVVLD